MMKKFALLLSLFMGLSLTTNLFSQDDPPLPVDWAYISATESEKGIVNIRWGTETEDNNEGFYVEKSLDGKIWTSIAYVPGRGDSSVPTHYERDDLGPTRGINYYRIKQMDYDRTTDYSIVVTVNVKYKLPSIQINPSGSRNVYLVSSDGPWDELNIVSNNGTTLASHRLNPDALLFRLEIDLSKYEAGLYFLVFNSTDGTRIVKRVLTF